jgi:hypothetical protein
MAVQVTGLFQNPQTNLIYESPLLTMVPQLLYANGLELIVNIGSNGSICYRNVDKDTLTYDPLITDAYLQLIDALDNYTIGILQNANPINSASTFTKYVTPVEPPVEE